MATDSDPSLRPLGAFFEPLRDRRKGTKKLRFPLVDLMVMSVVAVIGGADDWEAIALFAEGHLAWFRAHLNDTLPRAPSASTFRDVLTCLRPTEVLPCFEAFSRAFARTHNTPEHQVIDGKALCGSWKHGLAPLKLVHAWSAKHGTLTNFRVMRDGSELPAILALLGSLELKGTITTLDAGGAFKKVARTIVTAGGGYLLAIKGNQPTLHGQIAERMLAVSRGEADPALNTVHHTEQRTNGMEERTLWAAPAKDAPAALRWPGARSVVLQRRVVTRAGVQTVGWRYGVSTLLPDDTAGLSALLRGHWGIENKLHWSLDVVFREDASTLRNTRSQVLFAVLRRIAHTALTKAPPARTTRKTSLKGSRFLAGHKEAYLDSIIASVFAGS